MTTARIDRGRRTGGTRLVLLLTLLFSVSGVAAGVHAGWAGGPSSLRLPWAALVGLVGALAVAGCLQIRFSYRDHLDALDLFDAVLTVVIFGLPGPHVVLIAAVAKAVAQLALRVRPLKATFNVAQSVCAAGFGSLCFQLLRGPDVFSARALVAVCVAMGAVVVANHLVVVLMMGLTSRESPSRTFTELLPVMRARLITGGVANLAFGILLVTAFQGWAWSAVLFFVPLLMLHWANLGYAEGRADRARLAGLQRATHALAGPVDPREAVGAFLVEVRACFEAEAAELLVVEPAGHVVQTVGLASDEPSTRVERAGSGGVAEALLGLGRPARVSARDGGPVAERLAAEGWRDCLAAPLTSDGEILGVLCTYNRTGLEGFEAGEVAVLQALAGELTRALEKAQLVDDLLYQANHDALTGLPNRSLFQQRLQRAITAAGAAGGRAGVMLVDLDRFKEINDTLGHHQGDELLKETAGRLQASLRPSDTVARLGGDEFAVVVPVADAAGATEVADRLLAALSEPFTAGQLALDVGASIGIVLWPDHGEDPAVLLQRADVAMYRAKASQGGYQLYSADTDPYSTSRLTLGRELRCAVTTGALEVHYQPKVDLGTGFVSGVEALARWEHPEHGFVPPDEFIDLAERTGTIRPLTLFVLTEALRQWRSWRREGLDLGVAVNLSARSLLDIELIEDVDRLLHLFGVPADRLTLEITETSVMTDSVRSLQTLNRLHALGVRLSIDDFGTGHSSLAYLKRLPVDEVKIDRSFVMNMADDDNDAVIVRSTVDLGHNLGLRVVAEGVEDQGCRDRLAALGCDLAQGYHLGRPLPPTELAELVHRTSIELLERTGLHWTP